MICSENVIPRYSEGSRSGARGQILRGVPLRMTVVIDPGWREAGCWTVDFKYFPSLFGFPRLYLI
jgi:hypothetical protein